MRSRIALVVAATLLPIALAGEQPQRPSSQDEQPVFRTGVETVRFEAFVSDRKGNPVTGLTADDFEISEDGIAQTVQLFSPVELPLPGSGLATRISRPAVDVAGNDGVQDRIYVIVVDRLSWAGSMRATKIVRRFLEDYFTDRDLAALVTIDRRGPLHFTGNRAVLLDQLNDFAKWADYSATDPGSWATPGVQALGSRESAARAISFGDIASELEHVEARRKSVIYISARLSFDPYDAIDMPRSSFTEYVRAAMEPIMTSGLTVYPICPCVAGPMALRNMRALAYVTGATPIGSDWEKGFRQIVRDNSVYYVLGYDSTNPRRDGGFRRITIETKRRDLKVRARDGYFVEFPETDPDGIDWSGRRPPERRFTPRSDLPPELHRAMTSPVPVASLPMKVIAATHKGATRDGRVTFVVEVPVSALDLARDDGALTGTVDVVIGETADQRVLRGTEFRYDVHLTGDAQREALQNGLRLTGEVNLAPGDYRLHIAASTHSGRTGKVIYELTVPDFDDQLLMMSGVSLSSSAAAGVLALGTVSTREPSLPVPSAIRDFQRADTITVHVELYDNVWWTSEERTMTLRTELRGTNGSVIPMTSEDRSSTTTSRARGYGFVARVPLDGVPAGSYVLRVEGRLSFGTSPSVVREVPITVR